MAKPFLPEKLQWSLMASFGLAIPVIILFIRLRTVCPALELRLFDFLPLSGIVNGRDPQLFIRIMHDLTHPYLLLSYAVTLTFIAVRFLDRPLNERAGKFLFCGLALTHVIYCISFAVSLFLL